MSVNLNKITNYDVDKLFKFKLNKILILPQGGDV